MKRIVGVVPVLCVLLACDLEFTEPIGDPAARLSVDVRVADSAAGAIAFRGVLSPGREEDGTVRIVERDTLRVNGIALVPERVERSGLRFYSLEWAEDPDETVLDMDVDPPRVVGVPAPSVDIRLPLIRRNGPDTVVVAAGDTIELRLTRPDDVGPPPGYATWYLTVRRAGSPGPPLVTVQAETRTPRVIAVPTAWLPDSIDSDLSVELDAREAWDLQAAEDDYRVDLSVFSEILWTVRIAPPP